jgi:NADH-quinone oxidoreductase subunit G
MFLTPGLAEHATVVFPMESWAERDGRLTHPDGRLQRLRAGIGRPGDVRAGWQVLGDLCKRLGADTGILTGPMATARMAEHVPFYAGITLDEIGGRGVRWQERDAASAYAGDVDFGPFGVDLPHARARVSGSELALGTFRSIWAGPEVANSPALHFLRSRPRVLISPADAQRLELFDGLTATVAPDDREAIEATVHVRDAVPEGSAFLEGEIGGLVGIAGVRRAEGAVVA